MTMPDLVQLLGEHPFFFGMKPEHLQVLAGCAEGVDFATGSQILREGQHADACFLIIDGDVAVEITVPGRGPHVIQTLHGGDVLGWSWLFPPYRWSFDAQALSDTRAIKFDAAALRAAKDADCDLGYDLMQRFTEVLLARMQATRLQLLDVYGTPR